MTNQNTIGEKIRILRTQKNYTQDYLAQKIGVSQKAYSKLEKNEIKLTVEALMRISDALEIPVQYFFEDGDRHNINDFSSRSGGDNVLYKTVQHEKITELYEKLLKAKDAVIDEKQRLIEQLQNNT